MKAALARGLWPGLLACNIGLTWWLLRLATAADSAAVQAAPADSAAWHGFGAWLAPVAMVAHVPWVSLVPLLTLFAHLLLTGLALRLTGTTQRLTRLDWRDLGLTGANELIVLAGGNWLALVLLQSHAAGNSTAAPLSTWPAMTTVPFLPDWLPGWLVLAGSILLLDCAAYWLHRASHTWQLLWIFHAWHHTCDELNGANAFRFHLFDRIKTELLLIALVWGLHLPIEALLWYLSLANAQNINSHSALARHEKMPWQWLLNTPWLHYWHHSYVKAEQKHNYGSILSVWDSLFGTRLDPPLTQQPLRLGTGDVQPDTVLACMLYPLRRLLAGRDWI